MNILLQKREEVISLAELWPEHTKIPGVRAAMREEVRDSPGSFGK